MSKSLSNNLTQVLALIGCFVALVLVFEHYHQSADIGCSALGGDCKRTIESTYGHVGPIPTALFGFGMYAVLVGLSHARRKRLQEWRQEETARAAAYATAGADPLEPNPAEATEVEPASPELLPTTPAPTAPPAPEVTGISPLRAQIRHLDLDIWLLALFGFGISWWLQYTAVFTLHTFCPWCFSSAVLISLIFGLASRDYLLDGRKLTGEQRMLAGVCSFIFVLLAIVYYPFLVTLIHTPPRSGPVSLSRELIVKPDMQTKGDPKAPYLIVEFADYQCNHCKDAAKQIDVVLKQKAGQIRLGFRNYPLPNHNWAHEAAAAAEAAGEQGKFWEMHDLIFARQDEMDVPDFQDSRFDDYAQELHLDLARFDRDRKSDKIEQKVTRDEEEAQNAKVSVTPTFFVVPPDPHKDMTMISGLPEMIKALNDPQNAIWK